LSIYKYIPFARNYYFDGEHAFNAAEAGLRAGLKTVEAITPYADVLGFAGEGTFTGGTAEDRLKLILETIDKISPILDDITAELKTVQTELVEIDPSRYPEKIQEQEVRSYIITARDSAQTAIDSVTQYRPILEQLPEIMGAKGDRKKYLILFQNDNELRPTGGFLTAYSTIFIEDGKVTPALGRGSTQAAKDSPSSDALALALAGGGTALAKASLTADPNTGLAVIKLGNTSIPLWRAVAPIRSSSKHESRRDWQVRAGVDSTAARKELEKLEEESWRTAGTALVPRAADDALAVSRLV